MENMEMICQSIRDVLTAEANGITELVNEIGILHARLAKYCFECSGKIILTGMGKSGHIAKKISTTFASLGTPSLFLHPGEAAHGDLGTVESKDIVIMISKSGETEELIQLVHSLKVIGSMLIGIFCKKNSTLEHYCDYIVTLPSVSEACQNNLAPTTSTTMTMAFGDAIAVTLSKMKHFTDRDFALFHPLGTLGKRLLTTAEMLAKMNRNTVVTDENCTVENVLWIITENRMGAVCVTDDKNHLLGLITDGDIRRGLKKEDNLLEMRVSKIMTRNPILVNASMLATEMFSIMKEKSISVVPVITDNNEVVGMVSMHDILNSGII